MESISYAITVCNERQEIEKLLNQLFKYIKKEDEIIVQFDTQNGTPEVRDYLEHTAVECAVKGINFHRIFFSLNGDFSTFKNELISHCTRKWVFCIDADELCHENLLENLPNLLSINATDVIALPRENYVEGLTQEDINKWRWGVDEKNRINYPDYQQRIFLNNKGIKYINKVHEILSGYKTITQVPPVLEGWCLIHSKNIDRQRRQNLFYEQL